MNRRPGDVVHADDQATIWRQRELLVGMIRKLNHLFWR